MDRSGEVGFIHCTYVDIRSYLDEVESAASVVIPE
jgi:hypothetical protein